MPVKVSVDAPVTAPVHVPESMPVDVPVVVPVDARVSVPVHVPGPADVPANAPVLSPVDLLVKLPEGRGACAYGYACVSVPARVPTNVPAHLPVDVPACERSIFFAFLGHRSDMSFISSFLFLCCLCCRPALHFFLFPSAWAFWATGMFRS